MYFLVQFTILALVVSGMVLRGMRRSSYAVRWAAREQEGLKYAFGTQIFRGRALGFLLRFAAPDGVRFLLRRETGFDRLAKALRLTVEPQMHDEKFDERFYVECEDAELLSAARGRPDLLKLTTALQARIEASGSKFIELRCEDGKLDLMLERNMSTGMDRAEHDAVAWLRPLVDAIRAVPPRNENSRNRGFIARLVFAAIFMAGVTGGLTVSEFFTERMVDDMALFRFSLPYSLAALGAALFVTLLWLGHLPGRHRVLAACLLVGVPGFVSCGVITVRWLDLSLPQDPPEQIALNSAELYAADTRHGTSYRVAFDSKDERAWGVSPILLSDDAYQRLRAAWGVEKERPASLLLHPGAFGLPWVELVLTQTTGSEAGATRPSGK